VKKLLSILLIVVYATSVLGITIKYHYCCGHLANISPSPFQEQKMCGCSANVMAQDCCKDELRLNKNDNRQIPPALIEGAFSFTVEAPILYSYYFIPRLNGGYLQSSTNFSQRHCSPPLFLLFSVFRI